MVVHMTCSRALSHCRRSLCISIMNEDIIVSHESFSRCGLYHYTPCTIYDVRYHDAGIVTKSAVKVSINKYMRD